MVPSRSIFGQWDQVIIGVICRDARASALALTRCPALQGQTATTTHHPKIEQVLVRPTSKAEKQMRATAYGNHSRTSAELKRLVRPQEPAITIRCDTKIARKK